MASDQQKTVLPEQLKQRKMMYLSERHHISKNHSYFKECDLLCFISKNLYNATLYQINQQFVQHGTYKNPNTNKWIFGLGETYRHMKMSSEFRTDIHHSYNGKYVPCRPMKGVLIQIQDIFSSYYAAWRSYNKNPHKFKAPPQKPKYKNKNGRNIISYQKEAISFKKKGYIHLSQTNIYIKSPNATKDNVVEIKIVPVSYGYDIMVCYKHIEKSPLICNGKIAAIDFGVNNLMAVSSNDPSAKPLLINGKPIKSLNQFYNKKRAKLQCNLPNTVYNSNKLRKLSQTRQHKVRNYMHKASSFVVDYLIKNGINTVIVGVNEGWKQNVNIGKRNNQNFVSIPYYSLRNQLRYKCQKHGIRYIEIEESYTSKCSALDLEPLNKQMTYQGNRVKRGLFVSSTGRTINADINGSLNIIRKVTGDNGFVKTKCSQYLVEDYAVNPRKVIFSDSCII
jgi:putative transposase